MDIATPSHTALPLSPCEVSFKCAADSPMYPQSSPPSACTSDGECFPLVLRELAEDVPERAFSVVGDVVLSGDMGVYSQGDGSRVRISLATDDVTVSWHERLVHARGLFSPSRALTLQVVCTQARVNLTYGVWFRG